MKVYYNSSLWSKDKGLCGLPQRINWKFEYKEAKRCIPVIYHFPKGIVFDIITFLEEEKLCEFFKKYEAAEESLTQLQRRCAEQEHPYQTIPLKEIWINGKPVEGGYSSSSSMRIPWEPQNDEMTLVEKAYSSILKDTSCFACERFCVPYPETHSKMQKLMRFLRLGRVNSLKFSTYPVQWFSPLDIDFEMSAEENEKELCFKHPVTGITHTLYFQRIEGTKVPFGTDINRSIHTTHSMYEIDPALPQGDTLQFNSSIQYTEQPENDFSPTATSSIGIIGGACGPTSIFLSSTGEEKNLSCGLHGLPLYSCFSVPSFQQEDTVRFIIEGINTESYDSKEYSF